MNSKLCLFLGILMVGTSAAAACSSSTSSTPASDAGTDAPISNNDAAADGGSEAASDAAASVPTMKVDGTACTDVTAKVTTQTAPDGKTWTIEAKGTCGALAVVDIFVASKDSAAYPQTCGADTRVQMSVGAEGDAGALAYGTDASGGSCSITTGPSAADQTTPAKLTATVSNGAGKTHTLEFEAK
jgi:hypothetical protein